MIKAKIKRKSSKDLRLNPEQEKGFRRADRNRMKTYGDEPDSRPKGRVLTPQNLHSLKKKKGNRV